MSRNVPKLRFKGFEDEWENYKLGSFSEKITEKNKGFKVKNVISNSAKNGLISQRDFFEKDIANKNNIDGYYIIKNGDFVYNPRKSNEAPYGPINKYKFKDDGVVSPLYFCFRINNKVSNEYLEEYFKSSKWYRYVHMNSDQGARHDRVSIKDSEVMNMKIKLPSLQEQEKIANFLSKVDSIIEKQEKKVEYWNSYKKGMMQKIFSQKIRFKDGNGMDYPEWQKKKLGNVCLMFSGGTPASKNKIYYDGDIPFIRSAEINSFTTELKISELGLKNSSAKIVDKGDLLYALYGATSGEVGIARMKGAINQAILCIRSKEIINCYLLNLLQYNKEKIIETYIQGGQGNLSASILKELNFDFPCLEEQTKIANFLSNIDNIIEKESKKLEELKQWKKGLLQQLFV
ncbi:restriction endonuclease subunit S [Clostridium perfringens]|uniref:restriction endonuclease subunit S n=1 Tax=Clostridium perfringens TaxID=1502 RepID=UPI000E0A8B9B|nr:restriction endonuclease subunit S [Clostridium perfringens]AXH52051.1 restriction endonuclease subunit S [Clostridium perfringens]